MAKDLPVSIIAGGASFGTGGFSAFHNEQALAEVLAVFSKNGHERIDTARRYPAPTATEPSEALIGRTRQADNFVLDTKVRSLEPDAHSEAVLRKSVKESLEYLNRKSVNVLYLHAPDRGTPFSTTFRVLNEIYKEGVFKELGISNYTPAEVKEIVQLCKTNDWIVPSVYQGEYNALGRRADTELFPILRKYNIAFVTYSPLAGGLLSGKLLSADGPSAPGVRDGLVKQRLNESTRKGLEGYLKAVKEAGLSPASVAIRWVAYHSPLINPLSDGRKNAIIFGGSKVSQFEQSFAAIDEGPLSQKLVEAIDEMWEIVKDVAPSVGI